MLTSRGQQGSSRLGKDSEMRIIGQLSYHSHAQGAQEEGATLISWVWCCVSSQLCPSTSLSVSKRTNPSLHPARFPTPTWLPDMASQRKCRGNVVMLRVNTGRRLPRVSVFLLSLTPTRTANAHCQTQKSIKNNRKQRLHFRPLQIICK